MLDIISLGRHIFWVSGILLILAAGLLVPLTSLGALSGEREHHTLDLLVVTKLQSWDIVWGKLLSTCLTGLIYLFAPLPLVLSSFWIGGVTIWELGILVFIFTVVMIYSSSLALFLSGLTHKTLSAVLSYYILHIGAIPILLVITLLLGNHYGLIDSQRIGIGNSIVGAVLAQHGWVLLCSLHPISAAVASEVLGIEQNAWFLLSFDVNRYDPIKNTVSTWTSIQLPSPWILYCLFALLMSAVLLWQATKHITPTKV